jgi:4-hydroxythreonine-4-phosphate dehydrogenase
MHTGIERNAPRPIVAITMGDPAGIGPEITVKALQRRELFQSAVPVVIGDAGVLSNAIALLKASLAVRAIASPVEAVGEANTLEVLDLHNVDLPTLRPGQVSAAAGQAAFQAITTAIDLAMRNQVHAVVTNPISKEALHLAGHAFPGHTEIFAHFTGTRDVVMMLAHGHFRVAHVSTHCSLKTAVARCTRERVLRVIELAAEACRDLGIADPHVGVSGLNPHAGENGLFGDEEQTAILPAIGEAKARGIRVSGPFPADTFFPRASGGKSEFDICIAQYHDQGHLAVKMKGFSFDPTKNQWSAVTGINVSLGLPIIRVSVDHGTAFDIASRGIASEASLLDALDYAIRAGTRRKNSLEKSP